MALEDSMIPVEKERQGIGSALQGVNKLVVTVFSKLLGVIFWAINLVTLSILLFFRIVASALHVVVVYIPHIIGRFVPTSAKMTLEQTLVYAGVNMTSEDLLGMTTVYSLVVSATTYVLAGVFNFDLTYKLVAALVAFIAVWIFPRIILDALIYRRTQNIEAVLPDILDIIAQNIRVGMTTDRALWSAARPEFGPLAAELQMAARATLTGTPLPDALLGITNRIKSDTLERTIRLIIQGITSGGELPAILQVIAADMRSQHNLMRQMRSETNAHVMFILFAILFGAPLLFAVSLQFILVFSNLFSKLDVEQLSNLPQGASMITLQPFTISPGFYFRYALLTLGVLCFMGSFLVGLLRTGRPISGIQSIPVLMISSIGIFLVMDYIFTTVFSGAFII